MLPGTHKPRAETSAESSRSSVHNYYERQVFDAITRLSERAREDDDFFADVACVALNHLPPRYIRHDVDLTFFLSPEELRELAAKVDTAVGQAIAYVADRS